MTLVERVVRAKHFFVDLDGTVYLDDRLLPGAIDLVETLQARGVGYTFMTNNSSRNRLEYERHLSRLGLPVSDGTVFTSGQAAALVLADYPGSRVFLLGSLSLAQEFGAAGVQVVGEAEADMVVVGFDKELSYARISAACRLLLSGARYIATHTDVTCPTRTGPLPDAGSVIALLEAATGRLPDEVAGKPDLRFLSSAARARGVALNECAIIGDRLTTDVRMALDAHVPAVVPLTGVTRFDDPGLQEYTVSTNVMVVRDLTILVEMLRQG